MPPNMNLDDDGALTPRVLARQALLRPAGLEQGAQQCSGIPLLPRSSPSGGLVDLHLVNQLRDETC
jgi:hypothetical protein